MIVFTGLSGSGKSSLAFDTIFAEGQRRYVESLSAYARQFLGQMDKPDVDFIEGLSPAVSIDQKSTSRNPRSTVGTITEVYDYLRLLFARAGKPHCPQCGEPISKQTPQQIVDQVLAMEDGLRFQVLAPVIRGRKGEYVDLFSSLQSQGYSRARIDGVVHQLTDPPKLKKQEKHEIAVVIDRLAVKTSAKRRLTDSVETALRLADGLVELEFVDLPENDPARIRGFSENLACPNGHPLAIEDLEPRSFSFNSPVRRVPGVHRHRRPPGGRPGAGRPGRRAEPRGRRDRAVGGRPDRRVLRPAARLAGRDGRLPHGHAVAQAAGQGAEGRAARHRRAGARPLPQPVRPRAFVLRQLRGRDPVPGAAPGADRVRLHAGEVRGLHAGGALPRLSGHPPQAGDPRGHPRAQDSRARGRSPRSRRCRSPSARTSSTACGSAAARR